MLLLASNGKCVTGGYLTETLLYETTIRLASRGMIFIILLAVQTRIDDIMT